jgi:hypothetical protein
MRPRMNVWVAVVSMVFVVSAAIASDEHPMGEFPMPDVPIAELPSGGTAPVGTHTFGVQDYITQSLSGGAFTPLSDSEWGTFSTGHYFRSGGGNSGTCADVFLPAGALVEGVTRYLYDDNASGYMQIQFLRNDFDAFTADVLYDYSTDQAGTPGWANSYAVLPGGDHTVDNDRAGYRVCIFQWFETGSTMGHRGFVVWYKLQVSPKPVSASFGDVPTNHPFFQYVEALVDAGITGGCGGGNYCPDDPITRGQMAVFLSAALGLHWPN